MKPTRHFGFAILATAGLGLFLFGMPPSTTAQESSSPTIEHAAPSDANPGAPSLANSDGRDLDDSREPKALPTTEALPRPLPTRLEDNSLEPEVDTTRFDEEARAAQQELDGRLAETQKKFDEDADAISSKLSQNEQVPPVAPAE